MSTFIKLTHSDVQGDLRINPIFISAMNRLDDRTEVYCMGVEYAWEVKETPEEIIKLSETKKYFTTYNKPGNE
jgi:hypothetical protein